MKEYFSLKPDNFADKDVYVCESRYSTKARMFKKIKVWTSLPTPEVKLTPRETPLEPKRVVSVFRDRVEKHKEELAELGEVEKLAEKVVQNVEAPAPSPPPADAGASVQQPAGLSYYQQLTIPGHTLRTGDCVYVRAENGKQLIAQIDSMWVDAEYVIIFILIQIIIDPTKKKERKKKLKENSSVANSNFKEVNLNTFRTSVDATIHVQISDIFVLSGTLPTSTVRGT